MLAAQFASAACSITIQCCLSQGYSGPMSPGSSQPSDTACNTLQQIKQHFFAVSIFANGFFKNWAWLVSAFGAHQRLHIAQRGQRSVAEALHHNGSDVIKIRQPGRGHPAQLQRLQASVQPLPEVPATWQHATSHHMLASHKHHLDAGRYRSIFWGKQRHQKTLGGSSYAEAVQLTCSNGLSSGGEAYLALGLEVCERVHLHYEVHQYIALKVSTKVAIAGQVDMQDMSHIDAAR